MKNNRIAYVKTDKSVTLNYNGETYTALVGTPEFNQVVQCLKDKDWEGLPSAASKALSISVFSNGIFTVRDGHLWMGEKSVPTQLANKIMEFKTNGLDCKPLVAFAEKILENPSQNSINQLFGFLEKNNHPITSDGYFIAYKSIREDWLDTHSATMNNSPGQKVSMPREGVDEDPTRTCSSGLHVANWEYPTKHFTGARLIEVKVHPRDVVAVPNDYDNAKMRVCEYIVLAEINVPREGLLISDETMNEDSSYENE